MNAISHADPVQVRRAAERIHRFDIQVTAGLIPFEPASGHRRCYDLVNETTRRRLVRALDIARGGGTA